MGTINGIVSDPIDAVQRDSVRAVAAIRRHIDTLKAQIALWEPQPPPVRLQRSSRW